MLAFRHGNCLKRIVRAEDVNGTLINPRLPSWIMRLTDHGISRLFKTRAERDGPMLPLLHYHLAGRERVDLPLAAHGNPLFRDDDLMGRIEGWLDQGQKCAGIIRHALCPRYAICPREIIFVAIYLSGRKGRDRYLTRQLHPLAREREERKEILKILHPTQHKSMRRKGLYVRFLIPRNASL